jgi:hypothetical protein
MAPQFVDPECLRWQRELIGYPTLFVAASCRHGEIHPTSPTMNTAMELWKGLA